MIPVEFNAPESSATNTTSDGFHLTARTDKGQLHMISRRALLNVVPAALLSQRFLSQSETYPAPKFQIGQRVKTVWHSDEENKTFTEYGIVRGVCWNPEYVNRYDGYTYSVYFDPHPELNSNYVWGYVWESELMTYVES